MQILPGESLAIFTEESIHILRGTSSADFQLIKHSDEMGAMANTVQNMPTAIFCDRRGITTLDQSDRYGDFVNNTLSHHFDRLYREVKSDPLWSSVNRSRSQYRIMNAYGRGIYLTFNNRALAGAMPINLGLTSPITAVGNRRNNVQTDEMFFGTADGWVYRMDYGVTFDGERIPAFLKFPFCHMKSPRQKKRFRLAVLDMEGDPFTSLQARGEIEHGHKHHADNRIVNSQIESGAQSFYNGFSYDLPPVLESEVYLEGTGTDLAMVFRSDSQANYHHTIHSMIIHYNPRGLKR